MSSSKVSGIYTEHSFNYKQNFQLVPTHGVAILPIF
jgi:hypothetical protein